jgi:hypothetical protein
MAVMMLTPTSHVAARNYLKYRDDLEPKRWGFISYGQPLSEVLKPNDLVLHTRLIFHPPPPRAALQEDDERLIRIAAKFYCPGATDGHYSTPASCNDVRPCPTGCLALSKRRKGDWVPLARAVDRPSSTTHGTERRALPLTCGQAVFYSSHAWFDRMSHYVLLSPKYKTGFDFEWPVSAPERAVAACLCRAPFSSWPHLQVDVLCTHEVLLSDLAF